MVDTSKRVTKEGLEPSTTATTTKDNINERENEVSRTHSSAWIEWLPAEQTGSSPELFRNWLVDQGKAKRTVRTNVQYAKRFDFDAVLDTGNISTLLGLPGQRSREIALVALANYAKFTGRYDQFSDMKRKHNLQWNKRDSIAVFSRFFNPDLTLDTMLDKIREMIRVLPGPMAEVVRFATLTGLRPSEACEAVRLMNTANLVSNYYDSEQETLRHYLFPDVFLRTTKKAYISYLSVDNYASIALLGPRTPTLNAISLACRRRNVKMEMKLCRRLFSSWLLQQGIPEVAIDMLSGRVSQSVFRNHYATPTQDLKVRVLDAVEKLRREILLL